MTDEFVEFAESPRYSIATQKKKLYFQEKILHRRLLYFKRGKYEGEISRSGETFFVKKMPFQTRMSASFSTVYNNVCAPEKSI